MKYYFITTKACPFCPPVKKFLDENNIQYDHVVWDVNPERLPSRLHSGMRSVPCLVFEIDGEVVIAHGYEEISSIFDAKNGEQ